MRRGRASGVSGDAHCGCQACSLWGEGIFVRRLFLILGTPLDQHPHLRAGTAGIPSSVDNTNCFFRVSFWKSRHRERACTSGRKLFGPGNFPARGLRSPRPARPPPRALLQELRSPSTVESGEVASRTASDECPRPSLPIPLRRRRERGANSPGRSRAPGCGGAAVLQREPTNFRGRPVGIAWWPG